MEERVVLPGDIIFTRTEEFENVVVGPGLRREQNSIVAVKCGVLKHKKRPNTVLCWVDTQEKRYVPVKGETVIAVITNKSGDIYRAEIGCNEQASISYLSFEGATKRNRPNVQIGDIIFARLLTANKDMAPELVCVDGYGKSKGLGVLRGGKASDLVFSVSLNLARKLLRPENPLLKQLANSLHYEIAIGMNGRVWVNATTVKETIAISNAISLSEHMTYPQINAMCSKILDVLAGF